MVIVKPIHSEVKEDVARALHNLFPGDNAETLPSTCARHAAAVRVVRVRICLSKLFHFFTSHHLFFFTHRIKRTMKMHFDGFNG